jgi:hypothetical protein
MNVSVVVADGMDGVRRPELASRATAINSGGGAAERTVA